MTKICNITKDVLKIYSIYQNQYVVLKLTAKVVLCESLLRVKNLIDFWFSYVGFVRFHYQGNGEKSPKLLCTVWSEYLKND